MDTLAERLYSTVLKAMGSIAGRRSDEYKEGLWTAIEWHCMGVPYGMPYKYGTAAADAYQWGAIDGDDAWRRYKDHIEKQVWTKEGSK